MRRLYDSTAASDIPTEAQMVGGYVDGLYRWTDADWARFPNAVKVRIATNAVTDDGNVGDVERFDMTPDQAPGWVDMRRANGVQASIYVNRANLALVRAAFQAVSHDEPPYWLATLDGTILFPPGVVACQYAGEALTGAHYDLSEVLDFWPGVDVALEPPVITPEPPKDVMPAEIVFPARLVLPFGG